MQVSCVNCGARYQVDEERLARIRAKGPRCKSCGNPVFATPADSSIEALPAAFGPYPVVGRLGSGGMGTVYRGRDESLRRDVAIKVLLPDLCDDADLRGRFLVEARALARLVHPNITQIFTAGEDEGRPWFAMEFVDGPSTEQVLRDRGPFPPILAVHIVKGVCEGLKAAQGSGITHRDIKPGNILVAPDGTPKITDFGIAKLALEDHKLTSTGTVVGTVAYMSPEQARGEDLDFRSDIYSLGATFYELVMGTPPFRGDSAVTVLMKHASENVRFPVDKAVAALPPPLTGIIRRMMAKKPEGRYLSYDHLIDDLGRLEQRLESEQQKEQSDTEVRPVAPAPRAGLTREIPLPPAPVDEGSGFSLTGWLLIGAVVVGVGWFLMGDGDKPVPPGGDSPPAASPVTGRRPALPAVSRVPVPAGPSGPAAAAPALVPRPAQVEVVNDLVEILDENSLRVFGTLRNNDTHTLENLQVRVVLLDDYASQVATQSAFTDPKVVLPGESARFSVLFRDVSAVERYEVQAYEIPAPGSR